MDPEFPEPEDEDIALPSPDAELSDVTVEPDEEFAAEEEEAVPLVSCEDDAVADEEEEADSAPADEETDPEDTEEADVTVEFSSANAGVA